MNIELQAEELSRHLGVGDTYRTTCPACAGGSSGERTFTVGREPSRVWWKCFRDSCGVVGVTGCQYQPPAEVDRRLSRIKPYTKSTSRLTETDIEYFEERFELEADDLHGNVYLGPDGFVMPYRGPLGTVRGHVVRRHAWKGDPGTPIVTPTQGPKTITYPASTEPVCAWYSGDTPIWEESALVLVEDQISAIKVAKVGFRSLALLGTGVNVETIRDIRNAGYSKIKIALDPDAQGTAQQIRRKWGGYFESCRLVALEADPKDTPFNELQEALR